MVDTRVDIDPVVQLLKRLRERQGLTEARLATADPLLSAVGTSDPATGRERLLRALERVEPAQHRDVLRVDYGCDREMAFGRPPTPSEKLLLGERRSALASMLGRDVKTLSRWSDNAVRELRTALIDDTFRGDLSVVAAVEGSRIIGITVIEQDVDQFGRQTNERRATDLVNRSGGPSIPAIVYVFPRDWAPRNLSMAVSFRGEVEPKQVWATARDALIDVVFCEERHELPLANGIATCRFPKPSRSKVYALTWTMDDGGGPA